MQQLQLQQLQVELCCFGSESCASGRLGSSGSAYRNYADSFNFFRKSQAQGTKPSPASFATVFATSCKNMKVPLMASAERQASQP